MPFSPASSANTPAGCSRGLPDWLAEQHISLALTSTAGNRLLLIGRKPDGSLSLVQRHLDAPQAVTFSGTGLGVFDRFQLWRFENELAPGEIQAGADAVLAPRAAQTTGDLGVPDAAWDQEGELLFVNTRFSCLARLSERHSFEFVWKPPFISALVPEDRCHLTGVATAHGVARHVTAAGQTDVAGGWQAARWTGGCVIDVSSNEVVATNLALPHSPRWYQDRLWLLNSGTGGFGILDVASGKFEEVTFCAGYLQGLAFVNGFAVVGVSPPPDVGAAGASACPLSLRCSPNADTHWTGLAIIELKTGRIAHRLQLDPAFGAIADVAVLAGIRCPTLLGFRSPEMARHVTFSVGDQVRHCALSEPQSPNAARLAPSGGAPARSGPHTPPPQSEPQSPPAYRFVESAKMRVNQLVARFEHLTFPSLRQRTRTQRLQEPLYVVAAACGGDFVGLAVAQGAPNRRTAEIVSLYVRKDHRGRGLSRPLLAGLERLLGREGYAQLQLAYRADWPARPILEHRLKQLGWAEPRSNLLLGKFSVPDARDAWNQSPFHHYRLPAEFSIVTWPELTAEDVASLSGGMEADYPEELAPLEEPECLEPLNSLALRYRGRIVGWMLTHRLDANSIQYTRLHVEPPFQRLGRGLPLLDAAIQKQIDAGIPFGVFQVRADNPRMQRLVERRLRPYLVTWTESLRIEKKLPTPANVSVP